MSRFIYLQNNICFLVLVKTLVLYPLQYAMQLFCREQERIYNSQIL